MVNKASGNYECFSVRHMFTEPEYTPVISGDRI